MTTTAALPSFHVLAQEFGLWQMYFGLLLWTWDDSGLLAWTTLCLWGGAWSKGSTDDIVLSWIWKQSWPAYEYEGGTNESSKFFSDHGLLREDRGSNQVELFLS